MIKGAFIAVRYWHFMLHDTTEGKANLAIPSNLDFPESTLRSQRPSSVEVQKERCEYRREKRGSGLNLLVECTLLINFARMHE